MELHGTSYGGFALLEDSLAPDSVVLSFGIGEDASFDVSVIGKYGCVVHAFDPTPRSIAWVRRNISDSRFRLHECGVSETDGSMRLFLPKRTDWVSASIQRGSHTSEIHIDVPCKRLSSVVRDLSAVEIDVLKMDIEGAEYAVLREYFGDAGNPLPRQVALEFHHFYPEFGLEATRACTADLRRRGYRLCWVSDTHHEVTFVHESLLHRAEG